MKMATKEKSERSSTSSTNDKKYLFNMCLCYYYLYAEEQVSFAMKVSKPRKKETNHVISVELVKNQNGMLFENNKIYKHHGAGKNKKMIYDEVTTLPIIEGEHKSMNKEIHYSNKCILSTIILDKLKETYLFKEAYDGFWKCYISEKERSTSDYSQIVNLPYLFNKRNPGKRLVNGQNLRFADKKDYLQFDAEIILGSFFQQFQITDDQKTPIYLIISDTLDDQNYLKMKIDSKIKKGVEYRYISRQDMIDCIEMNLLHQHFGEMEIEEKISNTEPVSPNTSILHSEESQHCMSVFQPTSTNLYVVYEGYTPIYYPKNPFIESIIN